MNSGRLEALGDGIFSIAMTILVLELVLPEVKGHSWKDFATALHETWYGLLCYAISFIVLGIMWFGHRLMFEYIGRTDRYFIFLGVLFYMVVCLVPFSTRLLAKNTFEWYAIMVYGLNLSLCNITLYCQWLYGLSKPHMLHRGNTFRSKKRSTHPIPSFSSRLYNRNYYFFLHSMDKHCYFYCNANTVFDTL